MARFTRSAEDYAREIVESFVNGNRNDAYDALMRLPKRKLAAVVACMLSEAYTKRHDVHFWLIRRQDSER